MKEWKTLSKRTLAKPNRFLTLEIHEVELPDGTRIEDWPWLITPEFACILAQTVEGKFLCFRQTKYAIDGISLATPGGFIEPGEDPMEAAKRELREETGYEAATFHSLGAFPVDANRGAGVAHLFLATGASRTSDPVADDLEEQELVFLSEGEITVALQENAFQALPWAAAVALGLLQLKSES